MLERDEDGGQEQEGLIGAEPWVPAAIRVSHGILLVYMAYAITTIEIRWQTI